MDPEAEPKIRLRPLLPLRAFAPLRSPALAALLSLCVFLPGFTWGLPSREADRFLFGDRTPWTGEEIVALLGEFDPAGAADVDQSEGDGVVNDTDAERAEIVARYRLYSYQPDEMLTFRALAAAAGNRGDPRFYTYGGLWVYPVGGLIVIGQQLGLIGVGDQAYYLDNPAEFAEFYLVARGYAVAWAAVGAAVVCVLVRRVTRSDVLGVAAALTYALLPVVVVGAHEAKPHLPGAVLATWAVLPAERYVRTGRGLLWAGVLCGLAAGMVVTMAVSFLVLPTAWWLRRRAGRREVAAGLDPALADQPASKRGVKPRGYFLLAWATLLGVLAFAVTNPYVVVNAVADPSALAGNVGNTAGHYRVLIASFDAAVVLSQMAATTPLITGVLASAVVLMTLAWQRSDDHRRTRHLLLLLLVPAGVAWFAFALTAGGRPPDHARFALLPAVAAAGITFSVVDLMIARRSREAGKEEYRLVCPIVLVLGPVAFAAIFYVTGYIRTAAGSGDRTRAAAMLAEGVPPGGDLTVWADPAPAFVPPFDLWQWRARVAGEGADVTMQPGETPISWADRPVVVDFER